MSRTIPDTVTREQMLEAAESLLALLGLGRFDIYDLHISSEWISGHVVVKPTGSSEQRAETAPATGYEPAQQHGELCTFVAVRIED